ncbi:MAG: prolyl oligopeptidase family serine peptidase, partial [Nitriliruptorales bacterium]|nr:prolyl oligopeptidase family serine peptidase [Nitriliruptorales bacterium]
VSTGPLGTPPGVDVALNDDGWTNAVEIAVPVDVVAPDGTLDLSIMTGQVNEDLSFTPLNIAFRHAEPIDIYNDRKQAFALHGGAPDGSHIDDFSSGPIDLADLRNGRTQLARPGVGYHERQFTSGENISVESSKNGIVQPYGLYVPSDFDWSVATPITFWLHYRGGKTHSGATISPRLIHQLAREDPSGIGLDAGLGNIVVTPNARGTSYWFVSRSHQDVFEVFEDVHALLPNINPQRRYLAGYSMGGYGTYLMAGLYPDLFAAGFPVSGAVTQGGWTGVHDVPLCDYRAEFDGDEGSACYIEANSGNADAQNNYRILENTLHVPMHIDHGLLDELVPVAGVQRMAARLVELGHRVEMQTFPTYEHFTQAAVDEWTNGATYLQRFEAPVNPRRVTYKVVPALTWALNTIRWDGEPFDFNPDGAYWVDDIVVRDPDADDPTSFGFVDVTSLAIDEEPHLAVPVSGVASAGHSSPYVLYGLDWIPDPLTTNEVANGFEAELTGAAEVNLNAGRMNLDPYEPLTATMTTDGPATVTVSFFWPGDGTLTCDCGVAQDVEWDGRIADFDLTEAGTWTLAATLDPTGILFPGDDGGGDGSTTPATGGGLVVAGLLVAAISMGMARRSF